MHCLIGHGDYLELDAVPDGKPVQGAEYLGNIIPDGTGHNAGGSVVHTLRSVQLAGRPNNKLFRLSSLDVTSVRMAT